MQQELFIQSIDRSLKLYTVRGYCSNNWMVLNEIISVKSQ